MRRRDQQLVLRVASPLRHELELVADREGRSVSDVVRRLLIEALWQAHETERGDLAA
jgi:hypothetical protein